MKKNLIDNLIKDYPKIFSKLECVDCEDGWYSLIQDTCKKLQDYTDKNEEIQPRIFKIVKVHGLMSIAHFTDGCSFNDEIIGCAEQVSEFLCEFTGKEGMLCTDGTELRVLCKEKATELKMKPVNGSWKEVLKDSTSSSEKVVISNY